MTELLVDLEKLAELKGAVDAEDLEPILREYLEGASRRLLSLRSGAVGDGAPEWIQVLHALKGSSALVGASAVAALCRRAEEALRAGQRVDRPELLEELQAALERTREALLAFAR